MEPVFFPGWHMLKLHAKPVPLDPCHLSLNNKERIFLVRQVEKQGEIHPDLDRLVAPDTQPSPRHIDDGSIAHNDVGVIQS